MTLSRRRINLLGVAACAGALGFALFAQYGLKLTPCHLCIFQRVEVLALGLVFLAATLHNPGRTGARVYAALIGLAVVLFAVTIVVNLLASTVVMAISSRMRTRAAWVVGRLLSKHPP